MKRPSGPPVSDPAELCRLAAEQRDTLHRCVGRVAVEFEHLMKALRLKLAIYKGHGLSLHHLGDAPPRVCIGELRRAIPIRAAHLGMAPEDAELALKLCDDLDHVNDRRNVVVHTVWHFGYVTTLSRDDGPPLQWPSEAFGLQYGKRLRNIEVTQQFFEDIADKCVSMTQVTMAISSLEGEYSGLSQQFRRRSKARWERIGRTRLVNAEDNSKTALASRRPTSPERAGAQEDRF